MPNKKQKIKPSYIKDAKGKVIDVYLDLKTYNAIIDRIKQFEKEIKKVKAKKIKT